MSVTARVNALKVKDPVTGNYYGTMLMSDDTMADVEALAEAVASMAELGTDSTLSIEGAAADAQATGNAIEAVEDLVVSFTVTVQDDKQVAVADKTFAEICEAYLASKNIIFKMHMGNSAVFQGFVFAGYAIIYTDTPADTCLVSFVQGQQNQASPSSSASVITFLQYDKGRDVWDIYQSMLPSAATISEFLSQAILAPSNPVSGQHLVYNGSAWTAQTMQIDGVPTASSTNPVASGGVKTALDAKADPTVFATVSGTTVTQTGADGTMYLCGELTELSFTAPATGITAIRFTSGTTPTVVTLTGITMPESWEGAEANTVYEISVLNGMGLVGKWSVSGS